MSVDRQRNATASEQLDGDSEADTTALATLDEHQEAIVQTSKIREMTVRPGLMKLPVSNVTTAENSEQFVVILSHPVEGDIRCFLPKPAKGWSDNYKLVRVLKWYDIISEDDEGYSSADPYALQLRNVYAEYDESVRGNWKLVKPPSDPRFKRVHKGVETIRSVVGSVDRTALSMYAFVQCGGLLGVLATALALDGSVPIVGGLVDTLPTAVLFGGIVALGLTLLGLILTDPNA